MTRWEEGSRLTITLSPPHLVKCEGSAHKKIRWAKFSRGAEKEKMVPPGWLLVK